MIRNLVITTLGLWVLTIAASVLVDGDRADPSTTSPPIDPRMSPPTPVATETPARTVGFAMNVHRVWDVAQYVDAIDELAAFGANSVLITTPMYQGNGASITIARDADLCPTFDELAAIIAHAQQRDLDVALMPMLLLREPRSNEWRGRIMPSDWDQWWTAYRERIIEFADFASRHGVDTLFVGSELNSTENMNTRWRDLIDQVRFRFNGRVAYSANWDRFRRVPFWDALDFIGISAWFQLTDRPLSDTDDTQLAARWNEILEDLFRFAATESRPILLSELGYPTVPWSLEDPWNYVPESDTTPDPDGQRRGFAAFFAALASSPDARDPARFAGFYCYEWDVHRAGGPDDFGYGIVGKPAYSIVAEGFRFMLRL